MYSTRRSNARQRAASVSAPSATSAPLRPETAASATTPAQGPQNPATASFGPGDPLPSVQFISDSSWPADLCLDRSKSNWEEWSLRLTLIADRHNFSDWLDGSFPQPDVTADPKGHRFWKANDRSFKAFMLQHISRADYKIVANLPDSASVFKALRKRHEDLGVHTQVILIAKALNLRFRPGTSMSQVVDEIDSLHSRIVAIGPLDDDHLRSVLLLNALGEHYPQLQSSIHGNSDNPNFSSNTVLRAIQHEEDLIRHREELGLQVPSTALAAQSRPRSKVICAHCKRNGHLADFCIQPGGKMEGRSIDDARAAQRAASSRASRNTRSQQNNSTTGQSSSANVATASSPAPTEGVESVEVNGKTYYSAPPSSTAPSDFADTAMTSFAPSDAGTTFEHHSWEAFTAFNGTHRASIDWSLHSRPADDGDTTPEPVAYSASRTPVDNLSESPFILDTGATCHISPTKSDFKSLRPIAPHPITGVGGARVHATGVGSIELCIASNQKVVLEDVLYIPTSTVRLVSVLCLNRSGRYVSCFDSDSCWVTNKAGAIILRGTVLESRRLYGLTLHSPRVGHTRPTTPAPTSAAHFASRTPDLETWHRRLGHCGNDTIVEMARKNVVQGMLIDLSSAPPRCNHCILGKQTRSAVPKVREGEKAARPLERVFVDLCGPMPCRSRAGRLYSMNIIDDFSSYMWSLPLRSKDEAAMAPRYGEPIGPSPEDPNQR